MIKDQLLKLFFIPLFGAALPFLLNLFSAGETLLLPILLAIFFYIGVTFLAWQGVVKITSLLRNHSTVQKNVFRKLAAMLFAAGTCSAVLLLFSTMVLEYTLFNQPSENARLKAALIGATGGIILSLVYEVVFLSVEKEVDSHVLQQIDKERQEAEVNVLKNELDPHFFFNCMNTLSYLVKNDTEKAYQFVHKLSSVYKYFLRNKGNDYVPLKDEMEFLENYYFLLRIRFDDSIRIDNAIDHQNGPVYILPCALQVLVENAIKHNFFSEKEPLVISIDQNGKYITVSNPVRPKSNASDSTKVGLQNLKARYRLVTNQSVLVQRTNNQFLVRLPIVKTNQHD